MEHLILIEISNFLTSFTAKGELPLEQLIGKRYQLADINLALDDIRHRKTTRASITID